MKTNLRVVQVGDVRETAAKEIERKAAIAASNMQNSKRLEIGKQGNDLQTCSRHSTAE